MWRTIDAANYSLRVVRIPGHNVGHMHSKVEALNW